MRCLMNIPMKMQRWVNASLLFIGWGKWKKMLILHALLVSYQYNWVNTWFSEARILILLSFSAKDPKRKTLSKTLVEEENILKQCIESLKSVEASRAALVSRLKEALHEQASYYIHVLNKISHLNPTVISFLIDIEFLIPSCNTLTIFVSGIWTGECSYTDSGMNLFVIRLSCVTLFSDADVPCI